MDGKLFLFAAFLFEDIPGPRYLDGRTANGTVGLAPNLSPKFPGTKWRVVRAGEGVVALKCLGDIEGSRWLDGRTADGTVVTLHEIRRLWKIRVGVLYLIGRLGTGIVFK